MLAGAAAIVCGVASLRKSEKSMSANALKLVPPSLLGMGKASGLNILRSNVLTPVHESMAVTVATKGGKSLQRPGNNWVVVSIITSLLHNPGARCMHARNRVRSVYRNLAGPEPPEATTGTIQEALNIVCPPAGQEPRNFTCPEHLREMLINVVETPADVCNRRKALYQVGLATNKFCHTASNILIGGIPDSFDGEEVLNLAKYVIDLMKLTTAGAYIEDVNIDRYRYLHDPAGFYSVVIDLATPTRYSLNGSNGVGKAFIMIIMYKDIMLYVQQMLAADVQSLETTAPILYLRNFASHTTGMALILAAIYDLFRRDALEAARLLARVMARTEGGSRSKKGFKEYMVAFSLPSQYADTRSTALSQCGITGNMNFGTLRNRGVTVFVQRTAPAVAIRPTVANMMADAFVTTVANLRVPEVGPFLLDMVYW